MGKKQKPNDYVAFDPEVGFPLVRSASINEALRKMPALELLVESIMGVEPRKFSLVQARGRDYYIDRKSFSLYDAKSGRCMSGKLRIVSPR